MLHTKVDAQCDKPAIVVGQIKLTIPATVDILVANLLGPESGTKFRRKVASFWSYPNYSLTRYKPTVASVSKSQLIH